jgi:ATP-dependent RNA helicase DDX55/SPB4
MLYPQVRKNVKGLRDFKQSAVEPDSVPYLDAAREKARCKQLKRDAALAAEGITAGGGGLGKGKQRCKAERRQASAVEAAKLREKKVPAAKRQKQQSREDEGDLEDDYRAYRKHKKGTLDDAAYKRSIGLLD